jgi:LysR family glycine cleavage system transcriptional activator
MKSPAPVTRLSRQPPLRNLRSFCAAARHRSFKFAADELYITPSAVSHQMKELEDALGVRLFERKTRALELTAAGQMLLDEVEPLLEALDRSLAQVARRNGRQTLRVLLPPFFANELFIPRLTSFHAAHPEVDMQIDTSDPRPTSHPATADVSILLSDSVPQGLTTAPLFSLSLTAVCAREHAAKVARLGSAVFRQMALIVHKTRPFAWSSWAEEVGLDTPEPKNVIELDTMTAVVRAAERAVGVALVPSMLCDSWFHRGALVRIFSVEVATNDTYYLASRPRDADKAPVQAFTRWALAEFRAPGHPSMALLQQERELAPCS